MTVSPSMSDGTEAKDEGGDAGGVERVEDGSSEFLRIASNNILRSNELFLDFEPSPPL